MTTNEAAKLLGKRGGEAGKGRPKRISPGERERRRERMRLLGLTRKIRISTD